MSDINEGIQTASLAVMEVQSREPSPLFQGQLASPMWEVPVPSAAAETDWSDFPS